MDTLKVGKSFSWTGVGLEVSGKPTLAECEAFGRKLPGLERSAPFVAGDFINYVEREYGEEASQIIDASEGWSESTARNYAWVCDKVPIEVRRRELSFKHHRLVAKLAREEQVHWLKLAAAGDGDGKPWSVARMAAALRHGADMEITGWLLLVDCGSEKIRAEVAASLAGKVGEVRAIDRRSLKRAKKAPKEAA